MTSLVSRSSRLPQLIRRLRPQAAARAALSTRAMPLDKVTVCGAAGGIGQPLSLELKQLDAIKTLALFDVVPLTKGVGVDLSHIDTPTQVQAFVGNEMLHKALEGSNLVVIPAGVPRKPGMTRDDLFNINAKIVAALTAAAARACPNAVVLVITNPVNSTVPIAATVRKRLGLSNSRLLGVTMLDVIRAHTMVAAHLQTNVSRLRVPVIGGHAGNTIIPLLSQVPGAFSLTDKEALTKKIAFAGDEVVAAKAGGGSATLSMAFAALKFVKSVIRGLQGEPNVHECAYVSSSVCDGVSFFASPVRLGRYGFDEPTLPPLDPFEKHLLRAALPQLKAEIVKGVEFGQQFPL